MKIPEYVSKEEVRKVCSELGISDWSIRTGTDVPAGEAGIIFGKVRPADLDIDLEEFRKGLEVELEHGTMFQDVNVTNNHPLLTGKIVIAHFREMLDYYLRLDVAEIEGDIFKALLAGDARKALAKQGKLTGARLELARWEEKQLQRAAG
ncbi:MAG: hypothetical protein P1S46_04750 [bacterium]|nr:hypothetical protein [bacterium]MDT8395324.1 DUF5661 family protein [bacterium]